MRVSAGLVALGLCASAATGVVLCDSAVLAKDGTAKFCGECGTKFESPTAKFCSSCGKARAGSGETSPAKPAEPATKTAESDPFDGVRVGFTYVYELRGGLTQTNEVVARTGQELTIKSKVSGPKLPDMAPVEMKIPLNSPAPQKAPTVVGRETIVAGGASFDCEIHESLVNGETSRLWIAKRFPFAIKSELGGAPSMRLIRLEGWAKDDSQPAGGQSRSPSAGLSVEVSYPFLTKKTFFPAIHHLCGRLGVPLAQVKLENLSGKPMRSLRVQVELKEFSELVSDTVDLETGATSTVRLSPIVRDAIANADEERPGAVVVAVRDSDGRVLYEKTEPITIASKNDFVFLTGRKDSWALAAVFVTPNDRRVDELISLAGCEVVGYQQGRAKVEEQAAAVYGVLAELGIHYRSACNTFLDDERQLHGQKIYFPAESLELTGANCVDGTVLLASALEKMELRPYLVLVPGHCFLAFDPDENKPEEKLFVET